MDKKLGVITLVLSLFLVLPMVFAFNPFLDLNQGASNVIQIIKDVSTPFFSAIIGDYGSEFLFAKILFLILIYTICNFVLKKTGPLKDQNGPAFIVSAVIAILAVRFISENQLTTGLLLPYAALGMVFGVGLPLFVIFLGLHLGNVQGFGRRITWVFVLVTMLVFGFANSDKIPPTMEGIFWIMFGIIIIFLVFDKGIHGYFKSWEINAFYKGANERTIAALQAEYLHIINVNSPQADSRRHAIEHQLRSLGANLP